MSPAKGLPPLNQATFLLPPICQPLPLVSQGKKGKGATSTPTNSGQKSASGPAKPTATKSTVPKAPKVPTAKPPAPKPQASSGSKNSNPKKSTPSANLKTSGKRKKPTEDEEVEPEAEAEVEVDPFAGISDPKARSVIASLQQKLLKEKASKKSPTAASIKASATAAEQERQKSETFFVRQSISHTSFKSEIRAANQKLIDEGSQSSDEEEEIVVSNPQPQTKKHRTAPEDDDSGLEQEAEKRPQGDYQVETAMVLDNDETQHFLELSNPGCTQSDGQQDFNNDNADNDKPQEVNTEELEEGPDQEETGGEDVPPADDCQPKEFMTNGVCVSTSSLSSFL